MRVAAHLPVIVRLETWEQAPSEWSTNDGGGASPPVSHVDASLVSLPLCLSVCLFVVYKPLAKFHTFTATFLNTSFFQTPRRNLN